MIKIDTENTERTEEAQRDLINTNPLRFLCGLCALCVLKNSI